MPARLGFAATIAFLLATAAAEEASAYQVKHSGEGDLVHWRRADVQWVVDRSVRKIEGGEAAVAAAVEAWSERNGAPSLSTAAAEGTVRPGFDGTNTITYAADGYEPAGDALAITLLSFDDRTGEVLDADVVLNGKYHLAPVTVDSIASLAKKDDAAGAYDVGRVLAHEMGHALALSDEYGKSDALMYPYVPRERVLTASPTPDDLEGLALLYEGTTEGAAASTSSSSGCSAVVVPRTGTRAGHFSTYAVVGVGLAVAALAFARSRGRRGAPQGSARVAFAAAAALVLVPPAGLGASRRVVADVPDVADDAADVHRGAAHTPAAAGAATAAAERRIQSTVTNVHTTSVDGVFRSELELGAACAPSEACPARTTVVMWGGTIGHVRQVVAGQHVPRAGDRVKVVNDGQRRVVRAMAAAGE